MVARQRSKDPLSGECYLFCARTRRRAKVLLWDGTGLCLFTKRLEHGAFEWPTTGATGKTVSLTSAQLSMLIEGIDWRVPVRRWKPAVAG